MFYPGSERKTICSMRNTDLNKKLEGLRPKHIKKTNREERHDVNIETSLKAKITV